MHPDAEDIDREDKLFFDPLDRPLIDPVKIVGSSHVRESHTIVR